MARSDSDVRLVAKFSPGRTRPLARAAFGRHPEDVDLVTDRDVGAVPLGRMIRDGIVVPLAPGFAAPLDLPLTKDDRASTLANAVPEHTVVSGLAGLWIHGGGTRPIDVDLVGLKGLHRTSPDVHPRGWRVRFHSGRAAEETGERLSGMRVATPERCACDALRWDDLDTAIPSIVGAIHQGFVQPSSVDALVGETNPRGLGAARMTSAWAAIRASIP